MIKNISYEISKIEGLDINDKIDFMIAESIIKMDTKFKNLLKKKFKWLLTGVSGFIGKYFRVFNIKQSNSVWIR